MVEGLPPITTEMVLIALAVLVGGWVVSRLVRWVAGHLLTWRGRSPSAATVFSRLAGWVVLLLALGISLTVAFPSVRPVDLIGGIGVVSIAAGIAFQTVLGNMFAGLVLLSRGSIRVGDQIAVLDHRGTIMQIDLTSSVLRTFDGQQVVVPNGTLHSEVVTVQTGYEHVRTTVAVDLDDTADLAQAREVAIAAMRAVPSVLDEPAPDALLSEIGTATVRMELRFWSGALQLETRETQHEVILAVLTAFTEHDIPAGSDVVVLDATPRIINALAQLPRQAPSESEN